MDITTFDRDAERRQRQFETLDRLAQRFGGSLSDAFAKNVTAGQRLDGVLGQIGQKLLNATLKAAMKPLKSSLETLFRNALSGDSKSDSDDSESATPFARGGVISRGLVLPFANGGVLSRGMVMPFAEGGVVASPTYFPLGRGLGLMGERGTEAIMPLARGPDGRLGVRAGGGGRPVAVTVNIATPDADSFRRSEAQVAAALARAVARGQRGL